MTVRVIHFAEDDLAAAVSRELLDRAVHEVCDEIWLRELWAPELRHGQRRFTDLDGAEGVYTRRGDVAQHRFRAHSRDAQKNGALPGNAALAYKFARLAALARGPDEDALLLVAFDTDHKDAAEHCRRGLDAAAGSVAEPIPAVLAEATPEFEAWALAGCDVASPPFEQRHAVLLARLQDAGHAVDPVAEPHRLQSKGSDDPRDAKTLAEELLGVEKGPFHEHPAARPCWEERALDVLRAHGAKAGIPEFLDDVRREVPRCYPTIRR